MTRNNRDDWDDRVNGMTNNNWDDWIYYGCLGSLG